MMPRRLVTTSFLPTIYSSLIMQSLETLFLIKELPWLLLLLLETLTKEFLSLLEPG